MPLNEASDQPSVGCNGLLSQAELNEFMFRARSDQIGSHNSDVERVSKDSFFIGNHACCPLGLRKSSTSAMWFRIDRFVGVGLRNDLISDGPFGRPMPKTTTVDF
jgi:hypothetical protein